MKEPDENSSVEYIWNYLKSCYFNQEDTVYCAGILANRCNQLAKRVRSLEEHKKWLERDNQFNLNIMKLIKKEIQNTGIKNKAWQERESECFKDCLN